MLFIFGDKISGKLLYLSDEKRFDLYNSFKRYVVPDLAYPVINSFLIYLFFFKKNFFSQSKVNFNNEKFWIVSL